MPNLILSLPVFVRVSEVMAAIGVLAGEPYETVDNENNGQQGLRFTGTQGPLASLRASVDIKPGEDPLGSARISFRSFDGMRRNWDFVNDDEARHPLMGKRLVMDDTPLAVAVGIRLCSLFGGRLGHEGRRASIEQNLPGNGMGRPLLLGIIMSGLPQKGGRKASVEDYLVRRVRPLQASDIENAAARSGNPDADADLIAALNTATPSRISPRP